METRSSALDRFFTEINDQVAPEAAPLAHSPARPLADISRLKSFMDAVSHRVEETESRQRSIDRKTATGFNVFDLIAPDENKLSDILAGLLNPKGTHGQGDRFLRLLLKQLGFGSALSLTKNATIRREAPTHRITKFRRRMDILVEAGILLAIDNKVDSLEQPTQVKDYLEHLDHCTCRRSIQSTLIYLTPDGREPESLTPAILKRQEERGSGQ